MARPQEPGGVARSLALAVCIYRGKPRTPFVSPLLPLTGSSRALALRQTLGEAAMLEYKVVRVSTGNWKPDLARDTEAKSNEMAQAGWRLVAVVPYGADAMMFWERSKK